MINFCLFVINLDAAWPGILPRAARAPSRPQAAEPADQRAGRAEAGRLRPGPRQVRAHQDLLQRGGHPLVQTTRYHIQLYTVQYIRMVFFFSCLVLQYHISQDSYLQKRESLIS